MDNRFETIDEKEEREYKEDDKQMYYNYLRHIGNTRVQALEIVDSLTLQQVRLRIQSVRSRIEGRKGRKRNSRKSRKSNVQRCKKL
jgi:hypothetical protein